MTEAQKEARMHELQALPSALESVLTSISEGDTKIETVSSTETFSDHGSLMDSKWIFLILRGSIVLSTRVLFSLTDDVSGSSVAWDLVWKSPVDFDSVDEWENLGAS